MIEKKMSLISASQNKTNLVKWVNLMHNQVNININKKTYTHNEYNEYYNNLYTNTTSVNLYFTILIILFVLCIIYIIVY